MVKHSLTIFAAGGAFEPTQEKKKKKKGVVGSSPVTDT